MGRKIKNHKWQWLMIVAILLVSCDAKRVFDTYVAVPNGEWDNQTPVQFDFAIKDTILERNLFINLRNNNDYPFSNIFLITKMQFPNGEQVIDTLEYDMADAHGQFLGEGITEIKESKLFYKEGIRFPVSGNYSLEVFQAMRKNGEIEGVAKLSGITDVGFRIEKIK